MTLRQACAAAEALAIQLHNDYAQDASLHGVKLELKHFQREAEEFSEEQKDMRQAAIKDALERKVIEKSKRNKKKGR